MRPAKMQQQKPRRLLAYSLSLCLSLLIGLAAGHQKQNVAWKYNDPHYDAEQYAKIFGQATGDGKGKGAGQEQFGPFQYQYVDHQPNCREGGQPVCATNGHTYFYFENDCKLEAHNMQLLFQHGTELELTEFDHCMPNCGNIKCNTVYQPVCAAAEWGPHQGQGVTFANECEVRRRECTTKETMRFLNKGPCRQSTSKLRSKGKRKHKHNRNRSTTSSTTEATERATTARPMPVHKKVFVMLAKEPSTSSSTTTTTTTTTSTTTAAPMKFHQVISNSDVSVSRAEKPYSVFDILDVGTDYDAIKDSSLSMYLPGIGIVTDTPPSTTSTTTTTTTTTPAPTTTTSTTTTAMPSTTAAPSTSTSTTSSKNIINFIYLPYRSSPRPVLSVSSSTAKPSTTSTTKATSTDATNSSSLTSERKSISNLNENSTENPKKTLEVPNENTSPVTTPITPIVVAPNATGFKGITESSTTTNTTPTIIKTEKN